VSQPPDEDEDVARVVAAMDATIIVESILCLEFLE